MPGPIDNSNPTGGNPGGGPARNNTVQNMVDSIGRGTVDKETVKAFEQIVEKILGAKNLTEELKKSTKTYGNELRQAFEFISDMEGSTKNLLRYQRLLAKDGPKASHYLDVIKALKEMEKLNKSQAEKGFFSRKHSSTIKRQAADIATALKKLEAEGGKALSGDKGQEFLDTLIRTNREVVALSRNMKGIRIGSLRADHEGAVRSFQHLFGIRDHGQQYRKKAELAKKIREARKERHAGRHETAKIRAEEVRAQLGSRFLREDGTFDAEGHRKATRDAKEIAREARKHGFGRIGSRVFARSEAARAAGEEPGVLNKAAMNILARGEGSIGRGVASLGLGALEGGAAGITEAAGALATPAAVIAPIALLLKAAFDKNQTMNADIADKLGASGIYGSGSPLDSIRTVRNNLNSGGLYNSLGLGYDKNLEIAAALQKAGFSNQNLSAGSIPNKNGVLDGSFGTLQRNVAVYGRMAGLDSSQTMEQTIKLITQYRQSLGSTEDFYIRVNKAAKTAGITSMKYIEIVDDVNSHYDRSNKLLESTVDTMRLLSVTGRNTAEDIKDAMDAVTGGGAQRPLEVKAYLAGQMFKNPMIRQMMGNSVSNNFEDSLDNLNTALGDKSGGLAALRERIQKGGGSALDEILLEAKKNYGGDSNQFKSVNGAILKMRESYDAQNNFAGLSKMNPAMAGVYMAQRGNALGENVLTNSMYQLTSVISALQQSGASLQDYFDDAKRVEIQRNPAYQGYLGAIGTDPKKANDLLLNNMTDAAFARVQLAKQGTNGLTPGTTVYKSAVEDLEKQYQILLDRGEIKASKDHVGAVTEYANKPENEANMFKIFKRDTNTLLDLMPGNALSRALNPNITDQEKNQYIHQAEQLRSGTVTTAELFAHAFEYLFNRLSTPLDFIANLLSKLPGAAGATATKGQLDWVGGLVKGHGGADALKSYQEHIDSLSYDRTQAKDQTAKDDIDRQIEDTQNRMAQVQKTLDAAKDDQSWKYLTSDDLEKTHQNIDKIQEWSKTVDGKQVKPEPIAQPSAYSKKDNTWNNTINYMSVGFNALIPGAGFLLPLFKSGEQAPMNVQAK